MTVKYISKYSASRTERALLAGVGGEAKSYVKGGEYARGSIQFSANPTANDVIVLNGVYVKFTSSASNSGTAGTSGDPLLVNIKASATLTVDELVVVLNATAVAAIAVATYSNVSSGTLRIVYDTLAVATSYTIVVTGLTAAPTSADTALTGGQAAVALSINDENIGIAISDTNNQYFTLADGIEFQRKVILLTAKGTGDAVVSYNSANTCTLNTANDFIILQFLGGDWRTVVNSGCTLA